MAEFWAVVKAIPALAKLFDWIFESYDKHVLAERREAREKQSKAEDVALAKLEKATDDAELADIAESLNKLRSP